ncbi:uncharacterized protein LOC107365803 [Tetranychus urticae]|nr:uncharacterized protein LOC107365803 [Tetranychus urticae]
MLWPGTTLISQKAGKSFEEYRREYYPTSKCPSPATQTHVCILNPTKGDRCAEGPFMRYEMNERFYLTSITSRCFSTGTPDLFTDVSLFNEKMRELAPKGCWRDKWDWSGTMFDRNQF